MIQTIDNFFEEDYFDHLHKYSLDTFSDGHSKFRTNHTSWSNRIVLDSKLVLIHEPEIEFQREILEKVNSRMKGYSVEPDNCWVLFYYWMEGSYIPWHNDHSYKAAFTFYLNKDWRPEWQGFFMYREGEEIKAIQPAPNRVVHNREKVEHCTTPVLASSYLRATLQVFEEETKS